MDASRREVYRRLLLEHRQRLQTDVNQMVDSALRPSDELSKMPIHIADLGTDAASQDVTLSLMPGEERVLAAIDHALARIDAGSYGECESCEQPIAPERLDALPHATLCIGCAAKLEQRS